MWMIFGMLAGMVIDVITSKAKCRKMRRINVGADVPQDKWDRFLVAATAPANLEPFDQLLFRHGLRLDGDTVHLAAIPAPAVEKPEVKS